MALEDDLDIGEYSALPTAEEAEDDLGVGPELVLDPTFEPMPGCCSPIPERLSGDELYRTDAAYEASARVSHSFRASTRGSHRSKKVRKIRWVVLDDTGGRQVLHVDKRNIIQMFHLEIPMRDMRLLDTNTRIYESMGQILVRDNALVFSVDYVKLIITADKVIVPMELEASEQATKFVTILETLIYNRSQVLSTNESGDTEGAMITGSGSLDTESLPFELHVLEAALGEIIRHLAAQVTNLELVAHPALEDLTKSSDTLNLERVRKIKTSHQRLLGRIKGAREMLERYLEDDQDMWRMCLTHKQEMETGSDSKDMMMLQRSAMAMRRAHSLSRSPSPFLQPTVKENHQLDLHREPGSDSSDFDLLEVENLLESYCNLVDDLLQKLTSLGEYIDDTEDYINIELDYNRNRLIKIEIIITTATFVLAFFSVVAGILGENLRLPDTFAEDGMWFVTINMATLAVCFLCFGLMLLSLKMNKLI